MQTEFLIVLKPNIKTFKKASQRRSLNRWDSTLFMNNQIVLQVGLKIGILFFTDKDKYKEELHAELI